VSLLAYGFDIHNPAERAEAERPLEVKVEEPIGRRLWKKYVWGEGTEEKKERDRE
jgi:hypothetical protein